MSPCSDSLSLRLPYSVKLAIERKSLTHYAKGTQSPLRAPTVCMYAVSGSISLPPGVLFAFPSQYWFAIGRLRVFSLGGWSPHLRAGFHVSRSTSRKLSTLNPISRTGLSPSVAGLSRPFQYRIQYHLQALPISLAATFRISVDFFSCSYLDVSVRCVRLLKLCIHFKILAGEFPHSDIRGSVLACQLPTLSQAATSFIACNRQGIHHIHLVA